ncbi:MULTISPECIES: hypothetical protein [Nitrosopumilus]|nr:MULTISPECIES: hypothetical protein [Nitrosopumilus]
MDSKDSILFWIDSVWSQFAFAKFLQEKHDADFYAISDLSIKNTNFLNKQKIVTFKKIWHIRDNQELKSGNLIDLNYLKTIEEKFGINIWSIVYADRYFYKYNLYHNFSRNEILQLVQAECKLYEQIIDEIKPSFLIIYPFNDFRQELLYKMCKRKGTRIMTLSYTRINYKFMLSEITDKTDQKFIFDSTDDDVPAKSFEELNEYFKKYPKIVKQYVKNKNPFKEKLKIGFSFFLKTYNSEYKKLYRNIGRTRFNIFKNEINIIYNSYLVKNFFKKNSLTKISFKENFIYFPIHFEPERSITDPALYYTNQIELITHIAKSLPVDYCLCVKEHPAQSLTGWKNLDFYKQIHKLPNVKLLHPAFSQEDILQKCSLVITIVGSTGMEALLYQKPVITFGDTIYSEISSVNKVTDITTLPELIQNSLKQKVNLKELNAFVQFIDQNSFDYEFLEIQKFIEDTIFEGGFLDSEITHDKLNLLFKTHKSSFELVANEYVKKIEYFHDLNKK